MSDSKDLELIKSLQSQITFLQQTVNNLSERVRYLENKDLNPIKPVIPLFPFTNGVTLGNNINLKKDFR